MDNDIKLCLEHWAEVNQSEWQYARIEIIQSPYRAVRLHIGNKNHGIRKEIPIKTRHYNLTKSGDVSIFESYHL